MHLKMAQLIYTVGIEQRDQMCVISTQKKTLIEWDRQQRISNLSVQSNLTCLVCRIILK